MELSFIHPVHLTPQLIKFPDFQFTLKTVGYIGIGDYWFDWVKNEWKELTPYNFDIYFSAKSERAKDHLVIRPLTKCN